MDNENNTTKQGRWARKRKARKQPKTYRQTAINRLNEMFRAGKATKRSLDKAEGETKDKIYSEQTFRTYRKQFGYFMDWVSKEYPEAVTLEDAHKHANDYLQYLIDERDFALYDCNS